MNEQFLEPEPVYKTEGYSVTTHEDTSNTIINSHGDGHCNKILFDIPENDKIVNVEKVMIKTEEVVVKEECADDPTNISSKNVFTCKVCSKRIHKRTINKHMRTHNFIFKCKNCVEHFIDGLEFILHMNVHTGKYDCIYCNFTTGIKYEIVSHVKLHGNINIGLKSHIAKKPFQCHECDKSYHSKQNLKIHMVTHTGTKQFECKECCKKFETKQMLAIHVRYHSEEKSYQCHDCEKKFTRKENLKVHMRCHTGEKPFQCNECRKEFSRKEHLTIHMRSHTGEQPFQCEECDKRFSLKKNLLRHTAMHTGERPFQCNVCDKKFGLKKNLIRHATVHYGKKLF